MDPRRPSIAPTKAAQTRFRSAVPSLTWFGALHPLVMVLAYWCNRTLPMLIFGKNGCPISRGNGHPLVTLRLSSILLGIIGHKLICWNFLPSLERSHMRLPLLISRPLEVQMAGLGMRSRPFPCLGWPALHVSWCVWKLLEPGRMGSLMLASL